MTQSLITIGLFLAAIACLPLAVKWIKKQSLGSVGVATGQLKFISGIPVGPNQKIVTVEVGPDGARTWLTLGVTAQSITCLHSATVPTMSSESSLPPQTLA